MVKQLLAVALLCTPLFAANHYVRDGGSGDGSDWANAWDALPSTLVRGDTYYVADGTYGSYTFDDAVNGTALITIKKCTAADHGTETGYDAGYCDGQAVFSNAGTVLTFSTGYHLMDGLVGSGTSGHGFKVLLTSTTANSVYGIHFDGSSGSNNTVRHTEITHSDACTTVDGDHRQDGVRTSGADYITLQYMYIHRVPINLIMAAGTTNWLVEYSWLEESHSTSSNHGQAIYHGLPSSSAWTIRYNVFKDINGSAAIFFSTRVSDTAIYGNIFWEDASSTCAGTFATGNLLGANPGSDETGVTGLRFYNNTIINLDGRGTASDDINFDLGSDNLAYNNIWVGTTPAFTNVTGDYNDVNAATAIFTNYAGDDFHLAAATTAGTTLASPYDVDMDGVTRGSDSTWDRGAYEYGGSDATPPVVTISSPTSSATYSVATNSINLSGTATDAVGVSSVTWANDRGGSGSATGTGTWSINNITLQLGVNEITVTGADAAANEGTDTITVTYALGASRFSGRIAGGRVQ